MESESVSRVEIDHTVSRARPQSLGSAVRRETTNSTRRQHSRDETAQQHVLALNSVSTQTQECAGELEQTALRSPDQPLGQPPNSVSRFCLALADACAFRLDKDVWLPPRALDKDSETREGGEVNGAAITCADTEV